MENTGIRVWGTIRARHPTSFWPCGHGRGQQGHRGGILDSPQFWRWLCQFSPFAEFVSFGRCSLNILQYVDMYLISYRVCMNSIWENAWGTLCCTLDSSSHTETTLGSLRGYIWLFSPVLILSKGPEHHHCTSWFNWRQLILVPWLSDCLDLAGRPLWLGISSGDTWDQGSSVGGYLIWGINISKIIPTSIKEVHKKMYL